MKKCTEITELLSAYADNELTGSDKRSVEEHLAACENCSALLEIYREISISVDESNTPVPDALRIGVMNRVRSETIPIATEEKKKKWWQHQVLLTRLAPIAACLAVVLIVWQVGGNMTSVNDYAAPEAAPAGAPAPETMPAPAASADSVPAPEAPAAMEYDWSDDDAVEEADMIMPAESAGGFDVQADTPSLPTPELAPGNRIADGEALDDEVVEGFLEWISNAYAEITITGDFPTFLEDFKPEPVDSWFGWEFVYTIPSDDVETLMLELINRPGISLVHNPDNQDSTYAIVFFSSN